MALPKYSDPGMQNRTEDEATNRVNDISSKLYASVKNKTADKKKPAKPAGKTKAGNAAKNKSNGFKEGNKDDSILDEEYTDYAGKKDFFDDEEDDDVEYHQVYYKKR